jgi:predicted ATP-dependent endonuclease of OLD family
MIEIFLDNFRGFQRTLLPVYDVNFLVGENSTGKSSFLGLISLFTSPQFWFYQKFDNDEVDFGHFDDIVSVSSNDRTYFSVGRIERTKGENEKDTFSAFLMTFVEKEGLPRLSRFSFTLGNREVHIRLEAKKTKYMHRSIVEIDLPP